jgi:rubredoxin
MPKATTEGGATNSWEPQPDPLLCAECGAQVAAGAPRCPECPSTKFEAVLQEHPGTGEPMEGVEHPADGTMSPPLSNDDPQAEVVELAEDAAGPEPEAEAPAEPQATDAAPEPAPSAPPRTPPRRA